MNASNINEIVLDIETIPCQDPAYLDEIRERVLSDFKAPSDMTKERACAELGMTDKDQIKFTSKDSALKQWAEEFKDSKSEEVIQAEYRKSSFDGAKGQLAVIGLKFGADTGQSVYIENWQHKDAERTVIREAFDMIAASYHANSDRHPLFIGHYHSKFDLRFLFQRAVILGIEPPAIIPFDAAPWDDRIFDTMFKWAGNAGSIKLDDLCKVLGVRGKVGGIDGSKVWDEVQAGRIGDVADYCIGDVESTYACYRRLSFASVPVAVPEAESIF